MLRYQFNKTSFNELDKQLKMRERALPTIKSKESALRAEVKKAKDKAQELVDELHETMQKYSYMQELWGEFYANLVGVEDVELEVQKIAGVQIPLLKNVKYTERPYNRLTAPLWLPQGVEILKKLARLSLESEVYVKRQSILESARKKTTQKVNLYEKVQIPGYQEAMLKIKRFLEDEENISKSSQKIIKQRIEQGGLGL